MYIIVLNKKAYNKKLYLDFDKLLKSLDKKKDLYSWDKFVEEYLN